MKKLKLKYPKQQSALEKGLGLSTINLFRAMLGINKNINAKKFLKIKKTQLFFKKFVHSKFVDKLNRAYFPFYDQRSYDYLNFLKIIQNYRGLRHISKLPARGQRTKTNAKTLSKRATTRRKKKVSN